MIGKTLNHYTITAALGKGGMGEVWVAQDTRLNRKVALKTLPPEMAADTLLGARFEREALAIAALNHPNIITIHSVEQSEGISFITMELVEGKTLAKLIPHDGLPLDRFLDVAVPLSEALGAAHEEGIVHRDLKPANIIVSKRGQLKVLDFGLAKIFAAEPLDESTRSTEFLTREGVVMGTAPYMSPEQLMALPLDHRTDIFSLGIVFYEMATGRRPFQGRSSAELASSILRDTPPPLHSLRPDLAAALVELIERCLEKEAGDRPQTAREVRERLEAMGREYDAGLARIVSSGSGPVVASQPTSIAVLPFSDMSPSRDQDWFCEGIAEEILNALTRIPRLQVATRTSAFRFKDPARDIQKIGDTLGVTTLLEGGVRTAGSRLRVTAQLVNTSDGYQLWSDRFDGQSEDVFDIQDQIADGVVHALKAHLDSSGVGPTPARRADVEAYHLYLKGRHFRYSKLDLKNALSCFEQAIERDASYAEARIALAEALTILVVYGMLPSAKGQARAREEIRKARALAGDSALANGIEGLLSLMCDWDTRASLEAFRRALEIDPSHISSRAWHTWTMLILGAKNEAFEQALKVAELDPQSSYANAMCGYTCMMADRIEEALMYERRALEIEPESLMATWMLGCALAENSDWEAANEWLGRAVERSARMPLLLGILAWCQASSGREAQARETLAELEERSTTEYVPSLAPAYGYSALGEDEKARELLHEAFAERSSLLAMPLLPVVGRLREEPLMQGVLQQMLGSD